MPTSVNKEWIFDHPVDAMYMAWVSSNTVIPPATRMQVCAEIGGHYRLFMDLPDQVIRCDGEFLEVEPNRRLVYTWQWQGDPERSRITVTFAPHARGCAVHLHHDGFSSDASRTRHDQGWDSYAAGLSTFLSR